MADAAIGTELELGVPDVALGRRLVAELTGTAMLVAIVIGSGAAAQRLSSDTGLRLLESAAATGAGLVALILTFGHVSGARFNPLVTATAVLDGDLHPRHAAAEIAAQVAGGIAGAVVANLMFDLAAVTWSSQDRITSAAFGAEVVATFGLLTVILGVVRSPRADAVAYAVGAYVAAAYWFTSSTSFANPAVTIARTATDTFAGIAPASAPAFIGAQILGAVAAIGLDRFLHPPEHHMTTDEPTVLLPTVLFLCIHNAGRSQMALGWFQHLAGDRAIAYSGGSEPADDINPVAVEAMAEVGIDITASTPRRWTDAQLTDADVVITMGCGDTCPYVPGTRYEDWPVTDPAGHDLDHVRPIRDDIRARVALLLDQLAADRSRVDQRS